MAVIHVDVAPVLERWMQSQRSVDLRHRWRRHGTERSCHSLHGNRTDLFCLHLWILAFVSWSRLAEAQRAQSHANYQDGFLADESGGGKAALEPTLLKADGERPYRLLDLVGCASGCQRAKGEEERGNGRAYPEPLRARVSGHGFLVGSSHKAVGAHVSDPLTVAVSAEPSSLTTRQIP